MRPLSPRRLLALTAIVPAVATVGCAAIADPERSRGADGLFDIVFTKTTPENAARMALDEYDPNLRYRGMLLLANAFFASEPEYIALFERGMEDPDPGVRAAAVRGLANHGEPRHAPMLASALENDRDRLVRLEAARALQRIHNPVVVPQLMSRTRIEAEPEASVRVEVADAMGQYAQGAVLDRLILMLEDDNLVVRQAALDSLRTLTGEDFGLSHTAWTRWYGQQAGTAFDGRSAYRFPVYWRPKHWYEHIPFFSPPPNEVSTTPVGFPRDVGQL